MKLGTALRLGRVSNLPTVWTNTLAGAVLASATNFGPELLAVLLAFSLFYTGGMFLNDAFDAQFDAQHRPERPIPSGDVSRSTVFGWGYAMLAAATVMLGWVGFASAGHTGIWPALAGLALAAAITLYNWNHKGNPLGPLVMGLCRVLVLVGAGVCYTLAPARTLWIGAALLLCYLIGLTYVAKQENLARIENLWPLLFLAAPVAYSAWLASMEPNVLVFCLLFCGWMAVSLWTLRRRAKGGIPRAVVSLIAGISLLDALLIAGAGSLGLAAIALAGFGITLFLQRYVAGT